jgi:subtilisin family serine protease
VKAPWREAVTRSTGSTMPNFNASPLATHRPGEVLVQFEPGSALTPVFAQSLQAVGGQVAGIVAQPGGGAELARVTLGQGVSVEHAIEILSRMPGVKYVEPDYVVSVAATSNDPSVTGGQTWGLYGDMGSPSNAFGSQATEAWAAGFTGSTKVGIGVVDSGVDYTHPDLFLNIWLNQKEIPLSFRAALTDADSDGLITFRDLNDGRNASYVSDVNGNGRIDAGDLLNDARWENGVDDDANGYRDDLIGWDFVNNDNDPMDDQGHGTHVSGTVAATGGNGVGVSGVAWAAQIVPLKFLDASGSGYTSNAVRALDYFTSAGKAGTAVDFAATNNSWGGGGSSQSVLDAITRGAQQQVLFVAAAGNGGADKVGDDNDATANYPSNYSTLATAGYEAVIAVAAITNTGGLASFSNFGDVTVDLGAPGSGIYSTLRGGGYGTMSGTSMATPHVSGAIALYAGASPGATAAQIRADLLGSTVATASLAGKTLTGGRLDAAAFVAKTGVVMGGGVSLTGTAGNDLLAPSGTGADTLLGLAGGDTLNGGAGADRLVGGSGDDLYLVDQAGDVVIELAGEGVDTVQSQVSLVLAANVENLTLTGAAAANGTGNELGNALSGNAAGNVLTGAGGDDELFGQGGADTLRGDAGGDRLDGGEGADRMEGGLGSDTYYVDSAGDVVVETTAGSTGGGSDKVISSASFTLGANVERLTLSGSAVIDGTGNTLDNILYGNGAANRLTGLSGSDLISGNSGNDTLVGGTGGDTLTGGAGADRFVFAKGEAAGDVISDFALGDVLQLTGYGAGSTIARVAGSTTDWLVTDQATGAAELLKLANGYALSTGDFLFV